MAAAQGPMEPRPIRRALLSVSDKSGIIELAQALTRFGVELVSTGGTARQLIDAGIEVVEVSDLTGFPEIMGGRVKTLHPRIHGALLARADDAAVMQEHGIVPIDLLVIGFYPFEEKIAASNTSLDEAIEHIDIGGPAMLRAAAKNFERVAVVSSTAQIPEVIRELEATGGSLSAGTRFRLSAEAFASVAHYDTVISTYFTNQIDAVDTSYPEHLSLNFLKQADLRYGENPHQSAAFYRDLIPAAGALVGFHQLQGKELSFNNIADADAAWECARQFDEPACVIVKHLNPCGAALGNDPKAAYERAYATDPSAAFGGIIAFNRPLDESTAKTVLETQFVEVLLAPAYDAPALEVLTAKKNVRVLQIPAGDAQNSLDLKRIGGGLLVQSTDRTRIDASSLTVVSECRPTANEIEDLLFAWRVAKFVKSNAMVFARDGQTLGIGAGQMSRAYSARIAAIKAHDANLSLDKALLASDAFLPFRDSVDAAAEAGVSAIIQPGGSMRDREVIAAANELGLAMVFTGTRHFRH